MEDIKAHVEKKAKDNSQFQKLDENKIKEIGSEIRKLRPDTRKTLKGFVEEIYDDLKEARTQKVPWESICSFLETKYSLKITQNALSQAYTEVKKKKKDK